MGAVIEFQITITEMTMNSHRATLLGAGSNLDSDSSDSERRKYDRMMLMFQVDMGRLIRETEESLRSYFAELEAEVKSLQKEIKALQRNVANLTEDKVKLERERIRLLENIIELDSRLKEKTREG